LDFLLNVLEEKKVDISLTQRSKTFTTLAFVSLAEDGERDFVFSRGADKKLEYDSSLKNDFKDNIVHLGAATALLGGDLEKAYGRYFFDALTQDAFISFDPNFRADLWRKEEESFITFVSASGIKETIPSITVKPIDTTGAGDAFIGCLLQQIANLQNPFEILENTNLLIKMVENANKAGAITTTNYGAIPSLPTRDAIFDSSEPHL